MHHLLYDYIPSTYSTRFPLTVTGFDNQMMLDHSSKYLAAGLDSLFKELNLPVTKQENYKSGILPLIDSLKYWSFRDTGNYSKCKQYLNGIKEQVAGKLSKNDFWSLVIENLLAENNEYQLNKIDFLSAGNIRDYRMAENLKWLKETRFPNEKIIVWAANAHVAKYADSSGKRNERKITAMGSFFTSDSALSKESYIIGFTSFNGEAGRLGTKKYPVRAPPADGFENWINKSYDFAFVDFRKFNAAPPAKEETFYLKGLGHNSRFRKNWTKIFDGVFFIRKMYSCQK